jgi:hypothetical protein
MTNKPADTLELHRECFYDVAKKECVFHRILDVLEVIAHSKSAIGEVVQDYAVQAFAQLKNIIAAGTHVMGTTPSAEDLEILHNANYVLKTIKRFLELVPPAMRRNNANMIGKEKISAEDIEKMSHVFCHSSQVQLLMVIHEEGNQESSAIHASM